MENQNNESKQQQKNPGLMIAHEKMTWKVGEDIIYFTGEEEQKPVAFIKLEKYEEHEGKKKPVFSSRDLDGNPLTENTSNLYELKRDIKEKEIELTEAMRKKELSRENPERIEIPASQSENIAKTDENEKGNELKKVRRTKNNKSKENEQNVSL